MPPEPGAVVIVGAGPAGLTAAFQLEKDGIHSTILEAISDPAHDEHESMLEWVGPPSTPKPSTPPSSRNVSRTDRCSVMTRRDRRSARVHIGSTEFGATRRSQ